MTPVAGSFHSTRARRGGGLRGRRRPRPCRRAAKSPCRRRRRDAATPRWRRWRSSAARCSSGQSETASEPSSHRLGLAVGLGDRARIEVVAADDDQRLQLRRADHHVEGEAERSRSQAAPGSTGETLEGDRSTAMSSPSSAGADRHQRLHPGVGATASPRWVPREGAPAEGPTPRQKTSGYRPGRSPGRAKASPRPSSTPSGDFVAVVTVGTPACRSRHRSDVQSSVEARRALRRPCGFVSRLARHSAIDQP